MFENLGQYFPGSIHGIDIDGSKIRAAEELKKKFISHNEHYQQTIEHSTLITEIRQLPLYFREKLANQSITLMLSARNVVIPEHPENVKIEQENLFPHNLTFIAQNVFLLEGFSKVYDTVLCMKMTKWIHLAFGDKGVYDLFYKISLLLKYHLGYCRKGGILVL